MSKSTLTCLLRGVLAFVLACVFGIAAAASNKWRIQVSGGAESDGTIAFDIALVDGQHLPVSVQVAKGTGENKVASRIRDAVREQAAACCKAEVDDGEDVLVKKKRGVSDFDIIDIRNSVDGVRLSLDRE